MNHPSRREFLARSSALAVGSAIASARVQPANGPVGNLASPGPGDTHRGPVVIASGNGRDPSTARWS